MSLGETGVPAVAQPESSEAYFKRALQYTAQLRTVVTLPFEGDRKGAMRGAGFLVDAERGWIMTNSHVVSGSQALVQVGRICGYDCTVIDPRSAFGSAARFPGETILDDWPDEALQALAPDARTAVVTLTHDPKFDDPALTVALRSPVFYIGALGSKKTHARRVERLTAQGFSADEIARIHAPVGLDIGARTPAEIAVSIMAQITATLRL